MTIKQELEEIFRAALKAVQPGPALLAHLSKNGDMLQAGGQKYDLSKKRVMALAAGKGAAPMADALEKLLGDSITKGMAVVKHGHILPLAKLEIFEAAHPVPDKAGMEAAAKLLDMAAGAKPGDLVICLLTGGASALLPAPAENLSLEDIQATTSALLASGAAIAEINAIRKHLSRLSGGQLARAANGAEILTLAVSDVIGDDLSAIASGPTAPDSSTFSDCLAIIDRYNLADKIPASVITHLKKGAAGELQETPSPEDSVFNRVNNIIIASNSQALAAAAKKAASLGMNPLMLPETMEGEAREVAASLIERAKNIAGNLKKGDKPVCLLAGGETTVSLKGSGLGGRNQEMALMSAILLDGEARIGALFAGTDGTDGPTDAAGGFAFPDTAAKMTGHAHEYLARNDSYNALKQAGELLVTGPTLTNVMDLAIIIVEPPA